MHSRDTVVSLCVCLSVTTLTVILFVHRPKKMYHTFPYADFLNFDSQISLKRLRQLFAYHGEP